MSCGCCTWNDTDGHKDFIRGGVDVKDFDDDAVRWKKSAKKKKRERDGGCRGNDGGAHVYVWVDRKENSDIRYLYSYELYGAMFTDHFGFAKHETKICAGCGQSGGTRLTEKYLNMADKVFSKYFRDVSAKYRGIPAPSGWRFRRWDASRFDSKNWERHVPEFKAKVEAERNRLAEVRRVKDERERKRQEFYKNYMRKNFE